MEFLEHLINWLGAHWQGIIAVAAIILTIMQMYIARRHDRISVKPHLFFHSYNVDDSTHQAVLINNGLGPAFIKKYQILLDGKEKEDGIRWSADEIKNILFDGFQGEFRITSNQLGKDSAIGSQERIVAFEFIPFSEIDSEDLLKRLSKLDVIIEYESAYGEKFELDTLKYREEGATREGFELVERSS